MGGALQPLKDRYLLSSANARTPRYCQTRVNKYPPSSIPAEWYESILVGQDDRDRKWAVNLHWRMKKLAGPRLRLAKQILASCRLETRRAPSHPIPNP